ncbi:uridine kinase [Encephalitozoon intestinalis ATCC 50506]|uniref:Uridine kinase n=1 Tax=Encephalitozoon intestinalis (strain ATCC 50506) TaxID=876142 RepID=E0S5D9_ENCIT|nr:uridine kinase [Encephalitozoon intestinalis ATCC 50506]ADM10924.1 uridine kinase [Encephalitozoon intestinalis ATCC 50506]UTX44558.1 uridine kinase [Encephalitozoon intestinalis]
MTSERCNQDVQCDSDSKRIEGILEKCFEGPYDPERRYIICIQGPTSSGKSTFARRLHGLLNRNGINTYLLALDSYYFKPINPDLDEEDYDFDNPAALDWESIFCVLKRLRDKSPFLEHRTYSGSTYGKAFVWKEKNSMPNVVIIEGVQGFNTVCDKIFNIEMFDPYHSSKPIEDEFVDRSLDLGDFKILKIFMANCASKVLSVRLRRDEMRGRKRDAIIRRFYSKTLPSMLRWIYSPMYTEFIKVIHGNFNSKKIELLMNELSLYFFGKEIPTEETKEMDLYQEFGVECTGECRYGEGPYISLDDKV